MGKFKILVKILFCLIILSLFCLSLNFEKLKSEYAKKSKNKTENELPEKLPFELKIKDVGKPLTAKEINDFTKKLTSFWKSADFYKWILRISYGVDKSTGKPDYAVWWHDVEAEKKGDLVTFKNTNTGGGHNIMIPTNKVLFSVIGGYLLTGDKTMGKIIEQYCKGITATMKGMVYDKNDKEKYIMARNIATFNQTYTIEGGKKKAVDYSLWFNTYEDWNAHRLHYANNPYWGDIYVTNMRSKDDVPHIFISAAFLPYVIKYGKDKEVISAAQEASEYLQGFAKDIVDNGYHIRTKDKDGKPYIPKEDLASFVDYEKLSVTAECNAKLSSALIGYGKNMGNNCFYGSGGFYEAAATRNHYFNYAIIHGFHLSAILHSLLHNENEQAYKLLLGLVDRINKLQAKKNIKKYGSWQADLAVFILQSASVGLPVTSSQVRLVQSEYEKAIDQYSNFKNWDLWDSKVADGVYNQNGGYIPPHNNIVNPEEMGFFLTYCFSPFKNSQAQPLVDCEIIKDIKKW